MSDSGERGPFTARQAVALEVLWRRGPSSLREIRQRAPGWGGAGATLAALAARRCVVRGRDGRWRLSESALWFARLGARQAGPGGWS